MKFGKKNDLLKWHNLTFAVYPNTLCHILMRLDILVSFLTNTIDQAMCAYHEIAREWFYCRY
jgi:hypothetical protein